MSHRSLRSYARFLVVLGWLHVVLFTLLGLAPWLGLIGPSVAAVSQWDPWVLYILPVVGLLVGALCALGFFVLSGVILVLLDQRDLLEELVENHRSLLRAAAPRQAGSPGAADPFDLSGIRATDDPLF